MGKLPGLRLRLFRVLFAVDSVILIAELGEFCWPGRRDFKVASTCFIVIQVLPTVLVHLRPWLFALPSGSATYAFDRLAPSIFWMCSLFVLSGCA